MVGLASSTSFRAQAAHFRFSPDSGHIAASHRSATKSADARRGVAHAGEFAKLTASVAADKRGVTRLLPHISRHGLAFFEKLPPCLVGIEACASSHHWSREPALSHTVRLMQIDSRERAVR